jgi:hypothetical protein
MNLFVAWPESIEVGNFNNDGKFGILADWINAFDRTVVCAKDRSRSHGQHTVVMENLAIVSVPDLEGWRFLQDIGCLTRQTIEQCVVDADFVIAFDKCHIGIIAARLALRTGTPYLFLHSDAHVRQQRLGRAIFSRIRRWISNDIFANAVAVWNYETVAEITKLPLYKYFNKTVGFLKAGNERQ